MVYTFRLQGVVLLMFACGACSSSGKNQPDAGGPGAASASVLTYHNDNARTGLNPKETMLAPANVTAGKFGKKFSQPVDSYVYAQPRFVPALIIGGQTHDVVFVVTENNSVYAFDANAPGPVLWHSNVGASVSCADLNDCEDLVPGAGITGTPVIDPNAQTMYLVSLVKVGAASHHFLHALDLTTGAEKLGGPVEISPTVSGTGANSDNGIVKFNPATHYQRCALLLAGGAVYIGIGSNAESDADNHGWIVGHKATDLSSTMSFCASPDDNWVSLWQSGGGLASDASGFVYAETANGTFDAQTGGKDYGDSALKLDASGKVVDYFTPYNQAALSSADLDFGSANPVVLPDQSGPVPHELLATGKPGVLYLINRDNMGHFHSGSDSQIRPVRPGFPERGHHRRHLLVTGVLERARLCHRDWRKHPGLHAVRRKAVDDTRLADVGALRFSRGNTECLVERSHGGDPVGARRKRRRAACVRRDEPGHRALRFGPGLGRARPSGSTGQVRGPDGRQRPRVRRHPDGARRVRPFALRRRPARAVIFRRMRLTRDLHPARVLILSLFAALSPACHRESSPAATATAPPSPPAPVFTPPSAPGEVGPLGNDCYDAKQAKPCPPDPSDPSGRKLPAHGGACRFPACRPCGSETTVAFRDEHGAPSSGFCICVPTSDSSGRGTFSCYSTKAWKARSN